MIVPVPNHNQLEVCGAVRNSGRCPGLCLKHGGCVMPRFGEKVYFSEYQRRCHRAHRIMAELNELQRKRTEVNHVPNVQSVPSQRNANQGNRRVDLRQSR